MPLGHEVLGSGPTRVIVLNDWMSDTSTWEPTRAYLDQQRATWVFADLRGYGRSREQRGEYHLVEAAGDVIDLASTLGWERFSIVGHSMSTLVALHLCQQYADRISRGVLVTPPPPTAPGAESGILEMLTAVAEGDDGLRLQAVRPTWGDRLSEGWIRFKIARWRESSDPDAVARYVPMFARDGLPDTTTEIAIPLLAVTGEKDPPHMRRAEVARALAPFCPRLEVFPILESGHYPMQETPPLLVSIVERFLVDDPGPSSM